MERDNKNIKTIFRLAYGARNFEHMRNRIMYSMNTNSPILYNRKKNTNNRIGRPRGHYQKRK